MVSRRGVTGLRPSNGIKMALRGPGLGAKVNGNW